MSDELVFYTNPMSRARTVRWMLEEVGQPYRTEVIQYGADMKSPAYLAINPMGKVPAITHRGEVVTEGSAICAYLADAFPDAGLAPPIGERARYYRWLFFATGPLDAALVDKALGRDIPPERAGMVGYSGYAPVLDAIEAAITGRDYIAADRFTAADLYLGSYVDRLEARPAFGRVAELDGAMPPPRAA